MSQAKFPSKSTFPRYDAALKRHAAEQVLVHLRPVAQVARQLQCSPQSVANWVKQHQNSVPPQHSSLSHPTGQASSCQHTKPLSHCSQSANASLCHSSESSLPPPTHFLPLEVVDVGTVPLHSSGTAPLHSTIKTGIASRTVASIEIVTPGGLILRFPSETSLDILSHLVRQLEAAPC